MKSSTNFRRLLITIVLLLQVFVSLSITVNNLNSIPKATRITELRAVSITCLLNDLIRITAPVISEEAQYYFLKPNGITLVFNISLPKTLNEQSSSENLINAKFYPNTNAIIEQTSKFHVFNITEFEKNLQYLEPNQLFLGPLLEEDYGNWILSIYTKDSEDEWIEIFQTFTLDIIEFVQLKLHRRRLVLGDTLHLSFAYPFSGIETCEIIAPRSTFDRFFTRNISNLNYCAFIIPNLTEEDEGVWKIIGVGKLTYMGAISLNLIGDSFYIWG